MTSLLGFDIGEVKGSSKAAKNVYAQIMNAVDLLCDMPDLGKQFGDSALEVRGYRTYLGGNYRIFIRTMKKL